MSQPQTVNEIDRELQRLEYDEATLSNAPTIDEQIFAKLQEINEKKIQLTELKKQKQIENGKQAKIYEDTILKLNKEKEDLETRLKSFEENKLKKNEVRDKLFIGAFRIVIQKYKTLVTPENFYKLYNSIIPQISDLIKEHDTRNTYKCENSPSLCTALQCFEKCTHCSQLENMIKNREIYVLDLEKMKSVKDDFELFVQYFDITNNNELKTEYLKLMKSYDDSFSDSQHDIAEINTKIQSLETKKKKIMRKLDLICTEIGSEIAKCDEYHSLATVFFNNNEATIMSLITKIEASLKE